MNEAINKIKLRPKISTIINNKQQSLEENFQNKTLRPILKLQNDLIFSFFNSYLKEKKIAFIELSKLKKKERINKLFSNDNSFKTELKGMVLGLLTTTEYKQYIDSKKELNKRIYTMSKERILSGF